MSNKSKKEYLAVVRLRYSRCKNKKEKSVVLTEVVKNIGIVRKSAIRLLRKNHTLEEEPIEEELLYTALILSSR